MACENEIRHLVGSDLIIPFIYFTDRTRMKVLPLSGGTLHFWIVRNRGDTSALIAKTSATPGEIDLDFTGAVVGDITVTDADVAGLPVGSVGAVHYYGLWIESSTGVRTNLAEGIYKPVNSTEDFA